METNDGTQASASDNTQTIKTLIVEDVGFSREGVEPFLHPHADIQVVGVAHDSTLAANALRRYPVDVIILRLADSRDALRILRELREGSRTMVMLLMDQNEPSISRAARVAGADEMLFGDQRPASVVTTVRKLGAAITLQQSA